MKTTLPNKRRSLQIGAVALSLLATGYIATRLARKLPAKGRSRVKWLNPRRNNG